MKAIGRPSSVIATALVIAALVTVVATQWASAGSPEPEKAISQAVAGLTERGVPSDVGAPDDAINLSLVQREAFLAKSRGVDLDSIELEITNANDKTLFVGETVLDRELDLEWSGAETLAESDPVKAVQAAITEKTDLSGLSLGPIMVSSDSASREIRLTAVATDAKSAGPSTASLMINIYNAVNDTNALKGGQIALTFVDIVDEAGQPLLKWVYDSQRGAQDWWQAPGMTTAWFETPGPDTISREARQ